jgi:hypothetical protein
LSKPPATSLPKQPEAELVEATGNEFTKAAGG